jgi:hypothetical protein
MRQTNPELVVLHPAAIRLDVFIFRVIPGLKGIGNSAVRLRLHAATYGLV